MSAARTVAIRFTGEATGLTRASQDGEKAVSKFADRSKRALKAAQLGALAFGGALVASLKSGLEGLRDGEEAEARFADALGRLPAKVRVNSGAIKANAEEIQKHTRFSYEDALGVGTMLTAQDGFQKALRSGKTTVQDATNVVLDLATAQGIDGPAAAKLLSKALQDPEKAAGALRKAGILLSEQDQKNIKRWQESGDKASAYGLIMDKVKRKTEGAAKAAGDTTVGQLDRAKNAWGEVEESLAAQVLPAVNSFLRAATKFSAWAQEHPQQVQKVVTILGVLAAVVGVVTLATKAWAAGVAVASGATKAWTAAMWLLNAAVLSNPIIGITVAVAALAAGVVILYKKFDTARYIINGAIKAIANPVLMYVDAVLFGFQKVLEGLGHLPKWLGGGKFDTAAAAVASLRKGIQGIRDDINALPTSEADDFAGALRKITNQLKAIPKVTNVTIDVQTRNVLAATQVAGRAGRAMVGGQVAGRAGGGDVRAGRSYMVGERGREMFTPDEDGRITPNHELGGGSVVNIFATGPTLRDIVRVEISEHGRRTRTAVLAGRRT